jgi:ribA/ribD-fused uncharacterized protein
MTIYFYKGVFSQFFRAPIKDKHGVCYTCNEQYMMAHKAKLMGDQRTYEKIMKETKPMAIKKLGRRVQFWNQDKWNQFKYDIVLDATRYKVRQHPRIHKMLIETWTEDIAEAAPYDHIWGIGLSIKDAKAGLQWRGTNLLGEAWMQVRAECYPTLVVPYRATNQPERAEQLQKFKTHMFEKLPLSRIIVVEQYDDDKPFNRGALLNLGISESSSPLICLHDVDLLPDDEILRAYLDVLPRNTVRHIGRAWRRYDSDSYLGGILMMWREDYIRINGFPNDFWGWGGEDDLLRDRIQDASLKIQRVNFGTIYDLEEMSLEEKLNYLTKHRLKCEDKWERRDWHRKYPGQCGYCDVEDFQKIGQIKQSLF